jgi:hypothetical protein
MAVTQTFNPSAVVNTITNTFNIATHGFVADKGVIYTTGGGTAIGGLVDGYKYYIIWIDANNFRLASTEDNARAGIAVDLLSTGSGTFHNLTSSVIFPNSAAYHDFFRRIRLLGVGLPIEGKVIEAESVRDSLTIIGGNNITLTDVDDVHNVFTINAPDYNLTVPVATTNIRLETSLSSQDVILTPVRGIAITRRGPQEIGFESFGVTETDTLHTVTSRGNITTNNVVINNLLVGKVVSTPGEDGVSGISISHSAAGILATNGNGTLGSPLLLSPDESQSSEPADTITINFTTPSAGSLSYTAVYKCSAVLTAGSVVLERKDPSTLLWVPLDSSTGTTERTSYQISNQYGESNSSTTDYRIRFSWSGNFEYVNYRIRVTFEASFLPGKEIISTDTDTDSFILGDNIGTGLVRGTNTYTGLNTFTDRIETNGLRIFQNNIEGTNSNDNIVIDPHGTGALELRSSTLLTDQTSFDLVNTTTTTVNAFGAATTIGIGAATGTLTIGNPTITGTNATALNLNGSSPSIATTSSGTVSVFNTNALTGNLFGAATTINVGVAGSGGTMTIKNDNVVLNGDLQVKGGDITTDQTSFNIINGTATTVQAFGAAETLVFASATGTTTFRSDVVINNDLQVKGGDLTTNATTFNLLNTTATTISAFGAATTIGIGSASGTTTVNNSLTVTGDLIVNGTTTTLNTSTLDVEDLNITVAKGAPNAAAANGAGLTVDGANATLTYLSADDSWSFNKSLKASGFEGTPIGTTTRAAAKFTTLDANGDVILGDAVADNITINSKFVAGTVLRTSQTASDTLNMAAWDTDDSVYRTFITLTAGAAPTLTINSNATGTIDNMNIGNTTRGTGKFTTLDASQTVTLSPDSYSVTISPTNTGTVTVNPSTAGTINNMSIGVTTAAAGRFTTLKVKDTSAAFDLSIVPTSSTALTADRSLTVDMVNAARTVKLQGNLDIGGNLTTGGTLTTANNFTTSGNFALTLTTSNTTNVTLPTTGTLATLAGSESLTNKKLGSLTSNGIVTTSGGDGTLSVTATTGSGSVVLGNGPSITAIASLGIRDTSAAFDVTVAAASSTILTAGRTLTIDVVNAARTVKLAGNIDIAGTLTTANTFTTSGNFALTLTTTNTTNVTLPTTGTLATLAGSESLTNKKLGSLTSNGIVTTSGGDGTLSVTGTSGTGSVALNSGPSINGLIAGSGSSTTDADFTVDASTTTYYSWIQSTSGTARTVSVSNLVAGRAVWIYLRNTNASTKTITIQASATTTGFTGINFAVGSTRGSASATTVTLAASTGTALVMVMNANSNFVGGMM